MTLPAVPQCLDQLNGVSFPGFVGSQEDVGRSHCCASAELQLLQGARDHGAVFALMPVHCCITEKLCADGISVLLAVRTRSLLGARMPWGPYCSSSFLAGCLCCHRGAAGLAVLVAATKRERFTTACATQA